MKASGREPRAFSMVQLVPSCSRPPLRHTRALLTREPSQHVLLEAKQVPNAKWMEARADSSSSLLATVLSIFVPRQVLESTISGPPSRLHRHVMCVGGMFAPRSSFLIAAIAVLALIAAAEVDADKSARNARQLKGGKGPKSSKSLKSSKGSKGPKSPKSGKDSTTSAPTDVPTEEPTDVPTASPSDAPSSSASPSDAPSSAPSTLAVSIVPVPYF